MFPDDIYTVTLFVSLGLLTHNLYTSVTSVGFGISIGSIWLDATKVYMFTCLRVGGLMFKTMMFSLEKEMKMVLKDTKNLWSDLKLREMIEFT